MALQDVYLYLPYLPIQCVPFDLADEGVFHLLIYHSLVVLILLHCQVLLYPVIPLKFTYLSLVVEHEVLQLVRCLQFQLLQRYYVTNPVLLQRVLLIVEVHHQVDVVD